MKERNILSYKIIADSVKCEELADYIYKLDGCAVDLASYDGAYMGKTFSRLQKVYDQVSIAYDNMAVIDYICWGGL